MADSKAPQQEPSMEEILASIRRIISEDDQDEAKTPPKPDARVAAAAAQPVAPTPQPVTRAMPQTNPEDEDVLDLTRKVDTNGTVVNLKGAAEAAARPRPAATPVQEVELKDIEDERPAPPRPAASLAQRPATVEREPAPTPAVEGTDLVSAATAQSATASLAALARAMDRDVGGAPIGVGGRTLEDIVKEIMRPMIREWLDAHLPSIVDRLVRREIERLSYRAQDH
jgi:cell pole-organizing protein PopZ